MGFLATQAYLALVALVYLAGLAIRAFLVVGFLAFLATLEYQGIAGFLAFLDIAVRLVWVELSGLMALSTTPQIRQQLLTRQRL